MLRLLAQVHATVTIISSGFRAPAAAPSLASDFQASFVHCGVSVPPLESPHQDPRSPCQRIRQPTPPGLYFFPTGTLVPACPDCSQDQGPNKARLRKKSSSFFLTLSRITTHPTTLILFPLIHLCPHHGFHGSSLARVSKI